MKKSIFTILSVLAFTYSNAQSYVGMEADNYTGIHGLIFNPANVVDSRLKLDFNIVSVDAMFGTDYMDLNLSNATKMLSEDFEFDEDLERFPKEDNKFLLNADVVGPSFMFNLNPKNSIGLITRVRAVMNVNNVNGELFENLADEFDLTQDFSFNMEETNTTTHVWGEIGLAYGRVLMNREKNFLKAGATFKYLLGAGIAQGNSNSINGDFNSVTNQFTSSGSLEYNTNLDPDEDYSFEDTSAGFGMDLGIVYEFRPKFMNYDPDGEDYRGKNKYKLKISAALTDIGAITYEDVETTEYNLNGSFNGATEFDKDFQELLDDNYTSTTNVEDIKVKLPTTLRLNADYSFTKNLFASINLIQPLNAKNEAYASRTLSMFSITPRYESKVLSLFIPISFSEYGSTAIGAGLRIGPLMIGSSTIITNLTSKESKLANIYAGFKIPVYQRNKIKKTKSVKKRKNNAN